MTALTLPKHPFDPAVPYVEGSRRAPLRIPETLEEIHHLHPAIAPSTPCYRWDFRPFYPQPDDRRPAIIVVTGWRSWPQSLTASIVAALKPYHHRYPLPIMLHGAQRGVDELAGKIAADLGIAAAGMPYLSAYGKAGGPMRNKAIVQLALGMKKLGCHVAVHAFHPEIEQSKGTRSMMKLCAKAKFPTILHRC